MKSRVCLLLTVCLFTLAACAHNRALDKGDDYYAAGDWQRAEEHYREALRADPDSSEARTKLERARRQKVESLRVQAEQAIATRQYLSAIAKARQAHETLPRSRTTAEVLEMVMQSVRDYSKSLVDSGDLSTAIHLWSNVRDQIPPFVEEAKSNRATLVEREVTKLLEEAEETASQGLDGAALLIWARIVELNPTTLHRAQYERSRTAVLHATRYRVSLNAPQGALARDSLDVLRKKIKSTIVHRKRYGFEIVDGGNEAHASLQFALEPAVFKTTEASRSEKKKYQSGTRDVANPRRAEVEEKLASEEATLTDLESKLAKKDTEVLEEQGKVTSPTANITSLAVSIAAKARERDSLLAKVKRQQARVDEARELVRNTPMTVDEPVFSDFVYEVRSVTRHAESRLTGKILHPDSRPEISFDIPVSDRRSDTGHEAHPRVDLAADSLVVPSDRSVEAALESTVARKLYDYIFESFDSFRKALMDRADESDSRLERLHYYVLHTATDTKHATPRVVDALVKETGLAQDAILDLLSRKK